MAVWKKEHATSVSEDKDKYKYKQRKVINKDQQRPTKTNKDKQRQIQYGKVETDSRAGNVCLKRQKLDNGLVASSQQKLSVTLGKQVRH